jgi:hypothetical protein
VALRRRRLGRLASLDPKRPIIRYEREKPGELIHIDIKKLGRTASSPLAPLLVRSPRPDGRAHHER